MKVYNKCGFCFALFIFGTRVVTNTDVIASLASTQATVSGSASNPFNMFVLIVLLFTKIIAVLGDVQCQLAEMKNILEGCDNNVGLNVTTVGGTVIDNHNCDVLLPKQVFYDEPVISYPLADSKKFYSIIMVDPDAPPQIHGEFYIHMLKSNVPGLALSNKEPKPVGVDFRAYKPPMPARGTGVHRYIFLLYEQAEGNSFLPVVPTSRSKFALGTWLYGKNLCGPVAATQFRCQY